MDDSHTIRALTALLRGDRDAVSLARACSAGMLLAAARREGVVALVAERLARLNEKNEPVGDLDAFAEEARAQAVADVVSARVLRRALGALATADVPAVIFKGEHLAHACYEKPDLRPRTDVDVLVREADRDRAVSVLLACGYRSVAQHEADLISYQASFVPVEAGAGRPIDLHWRLTNPQEFGGIVTADEVFVSRQLVASLGPAAFVPSTLHALVIALVHRVAHHAGHTRLIWDLDAARLSKRMRSEDWARLVEIALVRRLSGIFAAELGRASTLDSTAIPIAVIEDLERSALTESTRGRQEHATRAAEVVASVRALTGWGDRARLLRQHLIPSARYMRDVYAPGSLAPLPLLYVRRVVTGAWKYCRPIAG